MLTLPHSILFPSVILSSIILSSVIYKVIPILHSPVPPLSPAPYSHFEILLTSLPFPSITSHSFLPPPPSVPPSSHSPYTNNKSLLFIDFPLHHITLLHITTLPFLSLTPSLFISLSLSLFSYYHPPFLLPFPWLSADVAARGLDIPKIQSVIHYDVARSPQARTLLYSVMLYRTALNCTAL